MNEFEQSLYAALVCLPKGKICTYGQLAKRCGYPNYARHVGRSLSKLPTDTMLPWHRVINGQGKISLTGENFERQKSRLDNEGIAIDNQGKVLNFRDYLW